MRVVVSFLSLSVCLLVGCAVPARLNSTAGSDTFVSAVLANNENAAVQWIRAGGDVNALSTSGMTPLEVAAMAGNTRLCTLLIKRGAEVNPKSSPDELRFVTKTPLMHAAASGGPNVVRLLLKKGADPNYLAPGNWTALLYACDYSLWEKLDPDLLFDLSKGAERIRRLRSNQLEIFRLLLAAGAEPNVALEDGWTPIECAQERGFTNVVKVLRQYGAKDYGIFNFPVFGHPRQPSTLSCN